MTAAVDREAWLRRRLTGVGGSEVAALIAQDDAKYGCKRRVWLEKRQTPVDFEREDSQQDMIDLGSYLEPYIAARYEKKTGRKVLKLGEAVHPEIPEIRVNIDGLIEDQEKGVGVLEIKAVGRSVFFNFKREGAPLDYILQREHGILVHSAIRIAEGLPPITWGSFAVMNRDSGELMHWDGDASPVIQNEILIETPIFWNQVVNGPAPDRLEPDNPKCQKCQYRRGCQGDALVQLPGDSEITPAPELLPLLTERNERKVMFDQAEELLGETVEEIKTKLGARQAVMVGNAKIYYRQQAPRTNIQGKELLETYKKVRAGLAEAARKEVPDATDKEIEESLERVGAFPPERFVEMGKGARPLRFY